MLAVCGLAFEARLAAGPGVRTVAGAGRSLALAAAIDREVAAGAIAILSFGVAGALDPALRPGTLIVADRIVDGATNYAVNRPWSEALTKRIGMARAAMAGSDLIVGDPVEKARLRERTGAGAVDMESHVAARIAAAHGLPFAALRAIADPSERALPPAARVAMQADGRIDLANVLASLARTPGQLPLLLRVARDSQRASGALGRGRRLLGRGLGYPDLDQLAIDVV